MPTCLNFQQVRREAGLTSKQVAELAHVPLRIEYLYEIGGGLVSQESKEQLVRALATLTSHPYTLRDFEPVEEQPTVTIPLQQFVSQRGGRIS